MKKSSTSFGRSSAILMSAFILITMSGCGQPKAESTISAVNVRTNQGQVDSTVEEFRVIRNDVLVSEINGDTLLSASSGDAGKFLKTSPLVDERTIYQGKFPTDDVTISDVDAAKDTLIVGLPIGSLGEERVLGGVITEISNHKDENLGNLKLSDFPMVHGKLMIASLDSKSPQMILVGCVSDCKESSPRLPLIAFPVVAVDTQKGLLMVDLSAVGRDLDLIKIEDPTGEGTGLKSISTVTKSFDYSIQTIVFDVESQLTAVDPIGNPVPDTNMTVRWYLKSTAAFDPAFESRPATPGVGFFMTDTAAAPKIKRFSLARYGDAGIKYYLKNVPQEWQPAFASAFDEWNDTFVKMLGRKIFDYEFIAKDDPRNALLVTGDIRYNIVEWDVTNLATYGGLGPSEGNEYTGEDLSANVLIQGPTVMNLYTDWYKVGDQVKVLQAQGKAQEADALLREYSVAADAKLKVSERHSLSLRNAKAKSFRIHSELPSMEDPLAQRNDFDEVPPNVDFKTYMNGYFHDMLTHELGHNLGLRHNFRGNMGATDTGAPKSTSRSVMEYLGRRYRYLDGVGEYDIMALKYGYANVQPTHLDWFCTDEEGFNPANPKTSPECSSDDATRDPYTFFEFRLAKSIDYLTARGQSYAPTWNLADMDRELGIALKGLLSYASLNPKNATLTNFYGVDAARPTELKQVKAFVISRVKQQLCDANLDLVVAGKYDPAAQKLTRENIQALREKTLVYFKKAGVDLGFDVSCSTAAPKLAEF
jgi:hypothetical protein